MQFEYGKKLLTDRYTPFDIDKENLIGSLGEDFSHITCRDRPLGRSSHSYQLSIIGRAWSAILHALPAIDRALEK
jgi:hypothetical protein